MRTTPVLPAETKNASLGEVHSSVLTANLSFWRRALAFSGPAYLVSVGYMDPGNWATDLAAGAGFGYRLLWVLVVSNGLAILLQTLSARLGIVTGRDLAQACRESYPRSISVILWVLSEIAIVACDLAEVLGAAIALNLLFHIPLLAGVLVTAFDTLLLLWLQRFGIRTIESIIIVLIATIAACFLVEIFWAKPEVLPLLGGLVPRINSKTLYVAVGILGATVMPHNFFLHSALVQTRRIGKTEADLRQACKFNLIDSAVALNGAMLVNAAILVLSAAVFFRAHQVVSEVQQAYRLLTPMMNATLASILFAAALLCSGQSSTITGTLAGQIVMEGFLNIRVRPWLRRLITRSLAVIPAALVVWYWGSEGTTSLILLSQVVLSAQLPFAIIPMIHFTNDPVRMGVFANKPWLRYLSWTSAALIVALNVWLLEQSLVELGAPTGIGGFVLRGFSILMSIGLIWLLGWMTFAPAVQNWRRLRNPVGMQEADAETLPVPQYTRILVTLDHSPLDREALGHASALARAYGAKLFLLHVEEGATSQVYGPLASTAEEEAGREYLNHLLASLEGQHLNAETAMRYSSNPGHEIVDYARKIGADLLVMGAHGHGGLKDLIFGNTIDPVRHQLKLPILVVRDKSRRK
jgi:manganese transport protein